MEAFRVAPSGDQEGSRRVGSYADDADQRRRCRPGESFQLGLQVMDLFTQLAVTAGQ